MTRDLDFCPNCTHIQPIPSFRTYFSALVGKETYNIDILLLKQRYLAYQKRVHPDLTHTRLVSTEKTRQAWIDKDRELAQEQSAWAAKAYTTLLDPLLRAEYMLQLRQVDIHERDSLDNVAFLHDIMEYHEQLEDPQCTMKQVQDILDIAQKQYLALQDAFAQYIEQERLEACRDIVIQMKYWRGIQQAAQDKLHALDLYPTSE